MNHSQLHNHLIMDTNRTSSRHRIRGGIQTQAEITLKFPVASHYDITIEGISDKGIIHQRL